jgi:AcrR family transcriptional regulator
MPEIRAAALAQLVERGFDKMVLNEIASTAGASTGTLYRWYSSKAALVIDAVTNAVGLPAEAPYTDEPLDDLRVLLNNMYALTANPRHQRAFGELVAAAQSNPEVKALFDSLPQRQRILDGIQRLRRHRMLRPTAPTNNTIADLLLAPLYYSALVTQTATDIVYVENTFEAILGPYLTKRRLTVDPTRQQTST